MGWTYDVSVLRVVRNNPERYSFSTTFNRIIAQLHSATEQPQNIDGSQPDINPGPPGSYVSLGWEDWNVLFPWMEKEDAGRRAGWGYD